METTKIINDIKFTIISNEEISDTELSAYKKYVEDKYGDSISEVIIKLDGEFVDIETHYKRTNPFNRIRRITGYLNGDVRRFNNAKQSEVRDRVKHTVPTEGVN